MPRERAQRSRLLFAQLHTCNPPAVCPSNVDERVWLSITCTRTTRARTHARVLLYQERCLIAIVADAQRHAHASLESARVTSIASKTDLRQQQ